MILLIFIFCYIIFYETGVVIDMNNEPFFQIGILEINLDY